MWYSLWLACADEPSPLPPVATVPDGTDPPVAPGPRCVTGEPLDVRRAAPAEAETCAAPRAPDYATWSGGQALRLDVASIAFDAPVTVTVSGAADGEVLELYLGAVCALDCPGGSDVCFQPAGAVLVATGVAEPDGRWIAEVALDEGRIDQWFVLQATAPAGRRLSQPWVDRGPEASGAGPFPDGPRPVSPLTIRGLDAADEPNASWPFRPWTWTVPAGRRAQVTLDTERLAEDDDTTTDWVVTHRVDGVGVTVRADLDMVLDEVQPHGSEWSVTAPRYVEPSPYTLDLRLLPEAAEPQDWYVDADGDGFGDPAAAPLASVAPVPGASTDARDCAHADPGVYPGGRETCDDGVDQDCDGADRPCCPVDPATPVSTSGSWWIGSPWAYLGQDLAIGDYDGDGLDELYAEGSPGGLWWPSRTDASPDDVLVLPLPAVDGASMGSITRAGADDLVLFEAQEVTLYAGGAEPAVVFDAAQARTAWLAIGDVSGDGRGDLIVTTATDLSVYDALPAELTPVPYPSDLYAPTVADLDGDGVNDLYDGSGRVEWGPLPGAPGPSLDLSGVTHGDADGDGTLDLIGRPYDEATSYGTSEDSPLVLVVRGPLPAEGTAETNAWATFDTWQPYYGADVGWLRDHTDGRPGLFSASGDVWEVVGPGSFGVDDGVNDSWRVEGYDSEVKGGDFDGDGRIDIVAADESANQAAATGTGQVFVLWSAY